MSQFPKRSISAGRGETGVNLVSIAVNDDLKWIFRRTHNEHDFGIDGYIDIVGDDGGVTGRSISVQIKCGASFFKESDDYGTVFRGSNAQLNYLLNHPTPTIIVVCNPETRVCYWEQLTPARTQGTGEGWKMTVPFSQTLTPLFKQQLSAIAGVEEDIVIKLKEYWALNKIVAEAGIIIYTIGREDIERLSLVDISEFFQRLQVSREYAIQNQDKVTLHVWGYDDDPRELWEIPEVRRWFAAAEPVVKYWFYFLRNSSDKITLKLLLICVCISKRRTKNGEKIGVEVDHDQLLSFIRRNFDWLNEITDRLGLPVEDNKRLSFNAMDALELPRE